MEERSDDDALQAGDDEQVRERQDALIAPVIDVVADVPVHAEDGHLQTDAGDEHRREVAGRHDAREALNHVQ
jgi:hypothetical protein